TAVMQLWYTGSRPAQVTVTFDDGTVVGPVSPGSSLDQSGVFIIQYVPGQEFYPWQSNGGDHAVWIRVTGHTGAGAVRLRGTGPGSGRFDLYGDLVGPNGTPITTFVSHAAPGRLTDYSSTRSAIVSGAHVVRTTYVDIDGVGRYVGTE